MLDEKEGLERLGAGVGSKIKFDKILFHISSNGMFNRISKEEFDKIVEGNDKRKTAAIIRKDNMKVYQDGKVMRLPFGLNKLRLCSGGIAELHNKIDGLAEKIDKLTEVGKLDGHL